MEYFLKTVGSKNRSFRSFEVDFCLFDFPTGWLTMLGKLRKLVNPDSQKTLNLLFF